MAQGTSSDLESLKEPLIEAVIDAYMKKQVPATVEGMEWSHGGADEGEFRYKHSRWGKDAKAYCYYPSGEAKTAHRVAEHAYDISTDFAKTEAQIEAGLDTLESRLS